MNVTVDIGQLLIGIGVLFGCYQSWKNGRKIEIIHEATNSMKDALVEATAKASHAEGKAEGIAEGKND